jgi:hypothetical protein
MQEKINELKKQLTGNLFDDLEIHNAIYLLKKQMNPEIEKYPEQDIDTCDSCGS